VFFSSPPWDSVDYWALDLETGGLDPGKDAILAVGMVPIRHGIIRLGESYRALVRPENGTRIDPRSVEAHQIVWGEVSEAPPLAEVVPQIERRLSEGVLLVHHRGLDVAFLKRAFRSAGRIWPRPRVVDTVDLLHKIARKSPFAAPEFPKEPPVLNLSRVRRQNGLPEYRAHDALTDALATAELFLVLRSAVGARLLRHLR